jgi:ABC-type transporter Mla subunit MlaD
VLTRTIEALDRVNRVLSDKNIKTFSASLSDVQAVTAELRERKEIIADAQKALQSIDQTAQSITELTKSANGLVDGDAKRTLKELGDAAGELKAAAKDARGMISKLEGPDQRLRHHRPAATVVGHRHPAIGRRVPRPAGRRRRTEPSRPGQQGARQGSGGQAVSPMIRNAPKPFAASSPSPPWPSPCPAASASSRRPSR